jgi:hypothetical protein
MVQDNSNITRSKIHTMAIRFFTGSCRFPYKKQLNDARYKQNR